MTEKEKLLIEAARRGLLPQSPKGQTVSPVQSGLGGMLEHGATLGLSDEVGGAAAATGAFVRSLLTDLDLSKASEAAGEGYERGLSRVREGNRAYRAEHPVLGTAAELVGGLATGGTLAKGGATLLNMARPTVPAMAARAAGEGAAYGGAYGFGTGEGGIGNRARGAAEGATIGGVAGGTLGGGAGLLGGKLGGKAAGQTTDDLRRAGHAAYDAAEAAGLVVSQPSFARAVDDIAGAAAEAGLDPTIHPRATAALKRLMGSSDTQPGLKQLDLLRRVIAAAAASPEADERRIARIMIDGLDDYVGNLSHADVIAGDPMKATTALNEARGLWSRLRKTEMIEDAVVRAERRAASAGSGGNIDNAIRQNIRAILDNPKKARGFTPDERKLMETVVRGGPMQNLLRLLGKLSPQGNGLMMMLHGVGGIASQGATLPLMMAGGIAKQVADRITPARVSSLLNATRSGGAPVPGNLLSAPQRALLEASIIGAGQQGGTAR